MISERPARQGSLEPVGMVTIAGQLAGVKWQARFSWMGETYAVTAEQSSLQTAAPDTPVYAAGRRNGPHYIEFVHETSEGETEHVAAMYIDLTPAGSTARAALSLTEFLKVAEERLPEAVVIHEQFRVDMDTFSRFMECARADIERKGPASAWLTPEVAAAIARVEERGVALPIGNATGIDPGLEMLAERALAGDDVPAEVLADALVSHMAATGTIPTAWFEDDDALATTAESD
jgi:hypothetical protein